MRAPRQLIPAISIALVALAGCTSSAARSQGTPAVSGPPAKPGPVTNLQIQQAKVWSADPSKWQVVLDWSGPTPPPDHFQVVRNDKVIAKDATGSSYTDTTAVPGTHYRYRVEAQNSAGDAGSPANATVKTGAPPLSAARLEGRFFASLTVTSSSLGVSSGADRWVLTPRCGTGPCDVTFSRAGTSVTGTLGESGANYAGTLSIPFHIRNCFGVAANESITIHLSVSDAADIHGEWRATKIAGTVHEYAAFSGCVPASTDYTVKGSVQT